MKELDNKLMKKRKIAFILNYGIEYRNFFLSGLSTEVAKYSDVVVLKRDVKNQLFNEYSEHYNLDIVNADRMFFENRRYRLENIFQSVRQSRMRIKNIGVFKNYNAKSNQVTIKDYLKGNILVYTTLKFLVMMQIDKHYYDKSIQDLLQKHNVTDIVISGYSSVGSIAFAVNARALHLNVWMLVNSWKDLYINEFVPFQPTGLFTWSEEMKNNYLALNKHLIPEKLYASGNSVFDRFFQAEPSRDRNYYEKKYGFEKDTDILLYTMLDPDRYLEEVDVIRMIGKALNDKSKNKVEKILVKKNPFDKTDRVNQYFENTSNIIVLEHFSERNKEADFFVQSLEGEKEWLDLLHYCNMTIGAASTVALESIMMRKPVITIAFDHTNKHSKLLQSMADAPFYQNLLERQDVVIVNNVLECVQHIEMFSKKKDDMIEDNIPEIIGRFDGKTTQRIVDVINNG